MQQDLVVQQVHKGQQELKVQEVLEELRALKVLQELEEHPLKVRQVILVHLVLRGHHLKVLKGQKEEQDQQVDKGLKDQQHLGQQGLKVLRVIQVT